MPIATEAKRNKNDIQIEQQPLSFGTEKTTRC